MLIGGTKHWPSYVELCKKIYGKDLIITDHLPQQILAYICSCKCSLLDKLDDTCGLVSLEAGINGTPVVGSTFGHELEYLKGDAWLVDPQTENIIRILSMHGKLESTIQGLRT